MKNNSFKKTMLKKIMEQKYPNLMRRKQVNDAIDGKLVNSKIKNKQYKELEIRSVLYWLIGIALIILVYFIIT